MSKDDVIEVEGVVVEFISNVVNANRKKVTPFSPLILATDPKGYR